MNFRGRNLEKTVSLPQEWKLMLLLMPDIGVALLVIATNNEWKNAREEQGTNKMGDLQVST